MDGRSLHYAVDFPCFSLVSFFHVDKCESVIDVKKICEIVRKGFSGSDSILGLDFHKWDPKQPSQIRTWQGTPLKDSYPKRRFAQLVAVKLLTRWHGHIHRT